MAEVLEAPSELVILRNVSWKTYESLLCDFEDQISPRLAFDRGNLEIMSPTPKHEKRSLYLSDLIVTVAVEWDIDVVGLGSTTFKRADVESGFEPDSCFYIQNASAMIGIEEIDLGRGDLPPDLVVEVEVTNKVLPKLPLYERLGVPEVWRVDKLGHITFHILEGGRYQSAEISRALPRIRRFALESLLKDGSMISVAAWRKLVLRWVREQP